MFATRVDEFQEQPTADLVDAFRQLGAFERAVHAERIAVLSAIDKREAWRQDGVANLGQWVTAVDVVSSQTGRAMAAAAQALPSLPEVASCAEQGLLSNDQLDAVVRIATPDTDADIAKRAPYMTPGSWYAIAQTRRKADLQEAEDAERFRAFRWWDSHGSVHFKGQLPKAEGAIVAAAIERLADSYKPAGTEPWAPYNWRAADALVELAAASSAIDGSAPLVVVHTTPDALAGETDAWSQIDEDKLITSDAARRLSCDAVWQLLAETPDGAPLGLGRKTRTIPKWMRDWLRVRDQGCRFSGCGSRRGLHAHHIVHWANGGPTETYNLVLLCHRHHHLMHEGGWSARGDPNVLDDFYFVSPRQSRFSEPPDPLSDAIRERFLLARPPNATTRSCLLTDHGHNVSTT